METSQIDVIPDQLLLDPNNYRFHDLDGYKQVRSRERYGERGVQDRALTLLQAPSFELEALRDSIASNGFVPAERLVVEHFDGAADEARYLVIEGNRRVAAVKGLLADQTAGAVDLDESVLESLDRLPALRIEGTEKERASYRQTLMAIRHVAGIREWGPYQQARLVVELYEQEEGQFAPVAQKIGISAREVGRRYRASKALQQMEEDDEFGEHASPKLYSFFHEAMSQPKVRKWLGFTDENFKAEDEEGRRAFYELLSPRQVEGQILPPKLQNANRQVRQLKSIVDKPAPLRTLLDPETPFEEAVASAEDQTVEDVEGVLERALAHALRVLREPGIDSWATPSEEARAHWRDLIALVSSVSKLIGENEPR